MDIEKMIERYHNLANRWENGEQLLLDGTMRIQDELRGAATALSTLQAENEELRAESIMHHNAADDYWYELNEYRQERNEALAELEQVKRERDAAVEQLHGICSACKNYSPYHNRGKCRFCTYEPARDKDAEVNDNWEYRGQKEE